MNESTRIHISSSDSRGESLTSSASFSKCSRIGTPASEYSELNIWRALCRYLCSHTSSRCCCRRQQVLQPHGTHLISSRLVRRHVAVQLGSVGEGVTAQGAAEVIFVLFMAVLDVFLQRGKTLVPSITIRAGEQLGKCIGRSYTGERTHRT